MSGHTADPAGPVPGMAWATPRCSWPDTLAVMR